MTMIPIVSFILLFTAAALGVWLGGALWNLSLNLDGFVSAACFVATLTVIACTVVLIMLMFAIPIQYIVMG